MAAQDAAPHSSLEQESAGNLLGRLLTDASALARNTVQLAKAELHETTINVKAGIAEIAIGAAILLAGVLALLAAAILLLAQIMEAWAAALIVGGVLAIVGFIMVKAAKKKLEPRNLALDRTQDSLRRDAEVVTRRT